MNKNFLTLLLILLCLPLWGQYTETINSNRPGNSQGAFSVGRGVLQLEAGPHFGIDDHNLTLTKNNIIGANYELRYGLIWEELEVNFKGDFLFVNQKYSRAGSDITTNFSNFRKNLIGIKYLIYDPYKAHFFDKPDLYSWKANQRFEWWKLIPAISLHVGANIQAKDMPSGYPFFGEAVSGVSPRVTLITQHNWGPFVLVMNLMGDRLNSDHKRYAGIFTLTHAVTYNTAIFAEMQIIKDDFYSDDLLRFGGTYLWDWDLQFDVMGMVNFRDTPSRWQVGFGVSYRWDFHKKDDVLIDPDKVEKKKTPIEAKEEVQTDSYDDGLEDPEEEEQD